LEAAAGHFSFQKTESGTIQIVTITPKRAIRSLGAFTILGLLIAAMTPVSNIMGRRLAVEQAIEPAGAIVVLGAGYIDPGTLREESLRRLARGIELFKQDLAPLIVMLGSTPEVAIRARFARAVGIPQDAIVNIAPTATTQEESIQTSDLLRQRTVHRILLVTESLHMRRAKLVFERSGFEVLPAVSLDSPGLTRPADRLWLSMRIVQEGAALIYYRLAGYI
jgi:uncharacterized SAM-binding protein YcdF (DUF218 family)